MEFSESVGSSSLPPDITGRTECCFFFRSSSSKQVILLLYSFASSCHMISLVITKDFQNNYIFPAQFLLLLRNHQQRTITIREGYRTWTISILESWFGEGWQDFCENNIIREDDTMFLRHSGNLMFDVLHYSATKTHDYLPCTHPLPSLLDTPEHVILKKQRMQCQKIASAMKPDFVQDLANGLSFCEIFTEQNQHHFKVPKFVSFFIHGDKAPLITLRTGNKTITLGMRQRQFTTNWNTFCFEHQLQFGDALVFIPETEFCYTVLIFDKRGVEKLFPWYNKFCIFPDAPTSRT